MTKVGDVVIPVPEPKPMMTTTNEITAATQVVVRCVKESHLLNQDFFCCNSKRTVIFFFLSLLTIVLPSVLQLLTGKMFNLKYGGQQI